MEIYRNGGSYARLRIYLQKSLMFSDDLLYQAETIAMACAFCAVRSRKETLDLLLSHSTACIICDDGHTLLIRPKEKLCLPDL